MLLFDSEDELLRYVRASQVCWYLGDEGGVLARGHGSVVGCAHAKNCVLRACLPQPTWTVANGELSFNVGAAQRKQVPSVKLITNTLAYASELERIV